MVKFFSIRDILNIVKDSPLFNNIILKLLTSEEIEKKHCWEKNAYIECDFTGPVSNGIFNFWIGIKRTSKDSIKKIELILELQYDNLYTEIHLSEYPLWKEWTYTYCEELSINEIFDKEHKHFEVDYVGKYINKTFKTFNELMKELTLIESG